MVIQPKGSRILAILYWKRRSQDWPSQDASHIRLDKQKNYKENSKFPRILQILPTIDRRFQQNHKTTIRTNKKKQHRQMEMGRQGTITIESIKGKTHHSTGIGLCRPPLTNQGRNTGLKIALVGDIITKVSWRKMESSGILMQKNVGCGMRPWYTRQGPSGNRCGIPQRHTLYEGEPQACACSHWPQQHSNFHDS